MTNRIGSRVELEVPIHAQSPEAGLYLDDKCLAAFTPDSRVLEAELPPQKSSQVVLELRCRGWVPRALVPDSKDDRTLGVTVFSVDMRAANAEEPVFDINAGDWQK